MERLPHQRSMVISAIPDANVQQTDFLIKEIGWFTSVVNERLAGYFNPATIEMPDSAASLVMPATQEQLNSPPDATKEQSFYADLVNYYQLNAHERLILILALLPSVQPQLLDVFFTVNQTIARGFTEFGGIKGAQHSGFIPTIETALFLLAGNDLAARFRLQSLFEPEHVFSVHHILEIHTGSAFEPFYSSPISISGEYVQFLTTGSSKKPKFSMDFPAKQLTTNLVWSDLVVDEYTAQQLDELRIFLLHSATLFGDWGMQQKLKPGYKVLFHGPAGTGKTLTAALLGKTLGLDVYRVDLSMVVSKYIGETEKNLEKVFRKAEYKNWILFFDEADALFGKRTGISDAHDKYANQEIAYLLQRLEDYPGVVILASNMRSNLDDAFTRRLQGIIHFGKPQSRERLRIWQNAFSPACTLPDEGALMQLAQQYDVTGGSIMNVVRTASLLALNRNERIITIDDLLYGIRKEYKKEGKTI